MASSETDPEGLTLHAVRLLGFADAGRVARRFGQGLEESTERLLDMEALGWVSRSEFGGAGGWSLTERGRAEGERRLALAVDAAGARASVSAVHERFLPLNARFQDAVTRWQIRPLPGAPMAANDHTDHRWDDRVLEVLGAVGRRLMPLESELTAVLARFGGYSDRYGRALDKAIQGDTTWHESMPSASTRATWCGCNCTRTCSPRWASTAATRRKLPEPAVHAPVCRARSRRSRQRTVGAVVREGPGPGDLVRIVGRRPRR